MRHGLAGARSECFPMDEAGHVRRLAMRELRGAHSAGSGLTLCAAIPTGNSMVEKHEGSVDGTCFQARHTAGCTQRNAQQPREEEEDLPRATEGAAGARDAI